MCYQHNKQGWCRSGDHYFGDIEFLRTDKCWEVLANPRLGIGGCQEGTTVNKIPSQNPVVEICETCEAAEAEEADQADDEDDNEDESEADDDDDAEFA